MKKIWHRFWGGFALLPACLLLAGEVSATARLGGVVSTIAGNGVCNDTKSVSLNTLQDTITLSAATAGNGGTASTDIHGEAAPETWLMLFAGLATMGVSLRGRRAPAA